jgi:hypothetical protein
MRRSEATVALVVVLALAAPSAAVNLCASRGRKATKLKALIQCVDGDQSGLDADFLRGNSPDDIARKVMEQVEARLRTLEDGLLRKVAAAVETHAETLTLAPATCDAIMVACEGPTDALLSCGANATGPLFSVTSDTQGTCVVGGCNELSEDRQLIGTATCLRVP